MAKRLMDKVMGFIGFDDETVEDEEFEEGSLGPEEQRSNFSRNKGQVVKLHSQRQVRVFVSEPKVYDEVQGISENLKNRCPVVINLENVDTEIAQRIIDFISGTTYALSGSMQKVGGNIFLCVPSNMDISSELKEKLTDRTNFDWINSR
ncbi:MAG: cell division protein SepF [Clostridiales bacterium]|nr:cell division protein SepF [Clostridiales bacterium]MCF8021338.1 cell division protein SepF [Clostridiales bacterium]